MRSDVGKVADVTHDTKHASANPEAPSPASKKKPASNRAKNADASRSALQSLSVEEVEQLLLSKLKGAVYVRSDDGNLRFYFADEQCDRCQTRLRSSAVRRLALSPVQEEDNTLEKADSILARPIPLEFMGSQDQEEIFFGRSWRELASQKVTRKRVGYCCLCAQCAHLGLSSGLLHHVWSDPGCPSCGRPIAEIRANGHWDGQDAGGRMVTGYCDQCEKHVSGIESGGQISW